MTEQQELESDESLAKRKERLLQQCRAYREGIGRARRVVQEHLAVESIAKTLVGLIAMRAQSALAGFSDLLDLKNVSGLRLQRLLPLVVSGVSLLSRRSVWKPLLRGAVVVGTTAATLYFFSRKKKVKETPAASPEQDG